MSAVRPALVLGLALVATGAAADGPVPPSRAKPKPAPRSFTNDDLDRYREERDAAKPATAAPAPPAGSESAAPTPSGEESTGSDTRAARFDELRNDLTAAEGARDATRARLRKIESLLNPMSAEFEVDPNVILGLQSELRGLRAQLEEHEGAVTRARAALEAFEDEARRAGVRLPARDN